MTRKPKPDFVNDQFNRNPYRHHPKVMAICVTLAIALGVAWVLIN